MRLKPCFGASQSNLRRKCTTTFCLFLILIFLFEEQNTKHGEARETVQRRYGRTHKLFQLSRHFLDIRLKYVLRGEKEKGCLCMVYSDKRDSLFLSNTNYRLLHNVVHACGSASAAPLPIAIPPQGFFITYVSGKYVPSMARLVKEAIHSGDFDIVHGFTREDIDEKFAHANAAVLNQERGGGYCLWKPYFVRRVMHEEMQPGDVLFYADAGCDTKGSPRPYIDLARQYGYLGFRLSYVIKHWNKGDVYKALGMDTSTFGNERQMVGVMMKTLTMTVFMHEWLHFASQLHLIDDSPSESPNAPDFVEHRHDQAIYTLSVYNHGLSMVLEDETDRNQYIAGLNFIMKNTSNFKEQNIILAARGKNDLQHPENVN